MNPNPALGVVFHWLGGLASASFYVPFRGVKRWAWETYWLIGGIFSWIIVPWTLGSLMTNDLASVLREASASTVCWTLFFGVLWGFGGLTYGLTMRYLGMSLGMSIIMGYSAALGTLVPPIFHGVFMTKVVGTVSGRVILGGIAVCLVGIALAGLAGISKEREMSEAQKKASIKEFSFKRGILVATFCGVMSACFSFALDAGSEIRAITLRHGTGELWQGLPVLVILLWGGFVTNLVWCVILHVRNRTGHQYFSSTVRETVSLEDEPILENAIDAPSEEMVRQIPAAKKEPQRVPLLANYLFAAFAGTTWYFQFFFYTMGETQMGAYKFSSWTLHMASIIIFASLWGLAFHEWKNTSFRTRALLTLSVTALVVSTAVVGYGNYLGQAAK